LRRFVAFGTVPHMAKRAAAAWLVKSEPGTYSIDDLARDGETSWEGVRNYQARNSLREMRPGDLVLVYHSNAEPSGVAGLAEVAAEPAPDLTSLDPKSPYFDPKATPADPRWTIVRLRFLEKFRRLVPLDVIKADAALASMEIARRGSRLSVTSATPAQVKRLRALGR
jgi:predicted RNA-binding protein with PUA-like domain